MKRLFLSFPMSALLLLLMLLAISPVQSRAAAPVAQAVEGQVKDTKGEPLIGASVMIEGTSTGTITDFDGHFSI